MGWNSASKIQIVKTSTFHQKGSFHHTTWHVLFKGQLHDENMVVFFRHSKTKGFRHYAGCILPTYRRVKFKHDHKFHRNFPKTVPNFHISNLFCLCRFLMTSFSFKKKIQRLHFHSVVIPEPMLADWPSHFSSLWIKAMSALPWANLVPVASNSP